MKHLGLIIGSAVVIGGASAIYYFGFYKPSQEAKNNKSKDNKGSLDLAAIKTKVKSLNLFRSEIDLKDAAQAKVLNEQENKLKSELKAQGVELMFDPKIANWTGFKYKGATTLV